MNKKFDAQIIRMIADSQEFGINDKLSKIISEKNEDELSEDELFMVSAASAEPGYEKFKKYLSSKKA